MEKIRARLAELTKQLEGFQANAEFSEDDITKVDAIHAEFETLSKQLETAEKMESMKAAASTSTRKVAAPAPAAQLTRVEVGASATDKFGGFKGNGEFFKAVKNAASGQIAPQFKNVMYEKNGEDGGFLIPDDIRTDIQKKLDSEESLLSKVRQLTVSGNSLVLPLDEKQPWNQGIRAYWISEGGQYTSSQGGLTSAHWRLHKLGAMCAVTDELLDDAVALSSYIQNGAPSAIMQKVNEAILSGDGVGKPKGLLNSGFTISVPKVVGQAADSLVPQNVIDMYSRLLPGSRSRAVWLINPAVEGQLWSMKDGNGAYYLSPGGQMNQTPYASLMGLPVLPMMSAMPALGDNGDIILADLDYYYAITKGGEQIKQAQSIHVYFDRDVTAFKFTMRIDGNVPFQSPVTTQFGAYAMSGIITLADRA